jgi:hypothetical protein
MNREACPRRKNIKAFVTLRAEEIPAHLQVADQAMGLVLGRNRDTANSGVQRIGKCKVDDARLSPEIDGWLGTLVGQLQKPASASTCQDKGKSVPRQRLVCSRAHRRFSFAGRFSLWMRNAQPVFVVPSR